MKERTKPLLIVGVFVAAYYVPWSHPLIRQYRGIFGRH